MLETTTFRHLTKRTYDLPRYILRHQLPAIFVYVKVLELRLRQLPKFSLTAALLELSTGIARPGCSNICDEQASRILLDIDGAGTEIKREKADSLDTAQHR